MIQSDGGSLQATGQDPIAEYILVSAPQTKLDVSFASGSQPFTHTWLIIADAFN